MYPSPRPFPLVLLHPLLHGHLPHPLPRHRHLLLHPDLSHDEERPSLLLLSRQRSVLLSQWNSNWIVYRRVFPASSSYHVDAEAFLSLVKHLFCFFILCHILPFIVALSVVGSPLPLDLSSTTVPLSTQSSARRPFSPTFTPSTPIRTGCSASPISPSFSLLRLTRSSFSDPSKSRSDRATSKPSFATPTASQASPSTSASPTTP